MSNCVKFTWLTILVLQISGCSVLDPDHNKEKLQGVRQKVFISEIEKNKDGNQKALKRCSNNYSVPKIKLRAQKKIDAFQTIGVTNKPVILKDKIVILTSAGELLAYNLDLNKKLWSRKLKSRDSTTTVGKIASKDGVLYVTYGINKLAAINSIDGVEIWNTTLDDIVKGTPIVYQDKIFLHSSHNHIYALKKNDGQIIWRHLDADHLHSTFADFSPVVYDNQLLFQVANSEIVSLDVDTGALNKIIKINHQYGFKGTEVQKHIPNHFFVENGVIYVNAKDGKLQAINYETQQELWGQKINSSSKFFLYGDNIYTTTNHDELAVVNKKTGNILYLVDLNSCTKNKNTYHKWTKPVIYQDSVLVTSYDGFMLKFDLKTGELLAEADGMEFITSSPAVSGKDVFVISNNGNIYKY